MLRLMAAYFLILIGMGGARAIDHGDYRGVVFILIPIFLWNWRWCLEFLQDRRWRENWRYW